MYSVYSVEVSLCLFHNLSLSALNSRGKQCLGLKAMHLVTPTPTIARSTNKPSGINELDNNPAEVKYLKLLAALVELKKDER